MDVKMIKTLFFSMFLILIPVSIVGQEDRLLAPPPPDAIHVDSEKGQGSWEIPPRGFTQAFHTPHSVNETVAFYNNHVGQMQEIEAGKHYRAVLIDLTVKQLGILKVYDVPRDPGVSVKSIRTMESRHCGSDLFKAFRDMSRELDHYSRSDFNEVCSRYGYLEHAYFGLSDQVTVHGRRMTRDEVMLREYTKQLDPETGEILNAEDMMAEAQRLMQQGKMEEATALFEKIAEIQQQAVQADMQRLQQMERRKVEDHWDDWLEFLEKLETMAYPTIVFINYHPSRWPDDEWLHENIEW